MTAQDLYDGWRMMNIILAIAAFILTTMKAAESWPRNELDVRMGRSCVPAFAFCAGLGMILATANGVPTGIWSIPITIPLLWAILYGLIGRGGLAERAERGTKR